MTQEPRAPEAPKLPLTRPPIWRVVLFALLAVALLTGLPYVRGIPPLPGTLAATFLVLFASLLVIREAARFTVKPLYEVLGLVVTLGVWYSAREWGQALANLRPLIAAGSSLAFLLACVFVGRLLSLIVREKNILLPVALMAGLADIFTVFFGPTGKTLQHAPKLVEQLSVGIPKLGSATGAAGGAGLGYIATAGLGDFIFLTFFFVTVWRFGLRERLTFWSIFSLLIVGTLAVLTLPHLPALPLLPFIILGFLLANLGAFHLSRTEKLQTVLVVALVTGLLVVAGVLMRGW